MEPKAYISFKIGEQKERTRAKNLRIVNDSVCRKSAADDV